MALNRTMAVVGAGLIGRAWASIFARAAGRSGSTIRWTAKPSVAMRCAARRWRSSPATALRRSDRSLARIAVAATLAEALEGVSFVQENAPEKVDVKQALYAELDRLAPPDAILSSSTSAIVASKFTRG